MKIQALAIPFLSLVCALPLACKATEGHDRAARKKNTAKAGQLREAGEPSETMGGTSKRGADHAPAAAKW